MGNSFCPGDDRHPRNQLTDPFQFRYNEDPKQKDYPHIQPLRCRNQQLQKILDTYEIKLRQNKTIFKDNLFKTDIIVLKSKDKQIKCNYQRPYQFIFGRTKDQIIKITSSEKCSSKDISIRDQVLQYFGVFLCFIAQNQHLVDRIIMTDANSYGLHVVVVYHKTKKMNMLIDDLILCEGGRPIFSQPISGKYLWSCILQKAWLKLKGSFMKKIIKSSPQEVFETFLPYPHQRIVLQGYQQSTIINKIKNHLYNINQQNACILTTKQNPSHKIGLSGRQHYYYLKSFIYQGKRLFYLRNPCGSFEFRGEYALIPLQIKNILKNQYKQYNIPSGNFIISEEQIIQQISTITIIHNIQDQKIINQRINFDTNKQFFIGFQLRLNGPLHIGLTQLPINRGQGNNNTSAKYDPLTYHLINITQQKIIGGQQNQQACFGIKNSYFLPQVVKNCTAGKYLLRLKKKSKLLALPENQYYISSSFTIPLKLSYNNQQQLFTKYQQFLLQLGHKKLKQKKQHSQVHKQMKQDVDHIIYWLGDLVVVYIQKINTKKQKVKIQVSFPQLINLQCISDTLKKGQYKTYQFEKQKLIIFEKIDLVAQTQIQKYVIESF